MIRIKQHIPSFVDVDERDYYTGETTADVLKHPWIQRWADKYPVFCKTSNTYWSERDQKETHQELLMCETEDGRKWWVLGYVVEGTLDLPTARMLP